MVAIRDMFEQFFTLDAVDKLRPMMQKTVDALLNEMIQKGCHEPVDFIRKFAEPIPIKVSSVFDRSLARFVFCLTS